MEMHLKIHMRYQKDVGPSNTIARRFHAKHMHNGIDFARLYKYENNYISKNRCKIGFGHGFDGRDIIIFRDFLV